MITREEVMQIIKEDFVPLLKQDEMLRYELLGFLTATFSTKSDFERVLQEIKISREETNKRFEKIDERFEEMNRQFEISHEETNKRFEEVNKRFEKIDERFEEMNRQFEISREETNKRFEEVNKRFEKIDERFEMMNNGFKDVREDFKALADMVNLTAGRFQTRGGKYLEEVISRVLRFTLQRPDLKPDSITLRKKIKDENGLIGKCGKEYEIDIYAHNSKAIIFEIKSYGDAEAVEYFNDKADFAKEVLGLGEIEKVFITLERSDEVKEACKKHNIILG